MKGQSNVEPRSYRVNWFFRILVPLAEGVAAFLGKITFGLIKKEPSPLTVSLTTFLAFSLVFIVATAVQGNFLPVQDKSMQLLEDFMAPVLAILFPLAVAITFRFYERLYRAFRELGTYEVIPEEPNKLYGLLNGFITRIDKSCNSLRAGAICMAISLLVFGGWAWAWLPTLIGTRERFGADWVNMLPLPLKIYGSIWIIMVFFLVLLFTWQVGVVWKAIAELSSTRETRAAGLRFSPDLRHLDGAGGFSKLSSLWLNINHLVVLTGIWIFGVTIEWLPGIEPISFVAMIGYAFGAPLLFFGPFLHLHSLMGNAKQKELEVCRVKWKEARDRDIKEQTAHWQKLYNEAKRFPTWPFNLRIRTRFWVIYLLPFIAPVMGPVYERILGLIWPPPK